VIAFPTVTTPGRHGPPGIPRGELLGIARQTLRAKLRDLGLSVTRTVEAEEDNPV
jgi:hypothetical protein